MEGGGGRIRTFHALFLSPSPYIDITIQLQLYIKEKKRGSFNDPCMKLLEAIQHFFLLFLFFGATDVRGLDTDKLDKIFPSSISAYKNSHWLARRRSFSIDVSFEIYTCRISASRWSTATTKVQVLKTLNRLTGLVIAFILEVQIPSHFFISSFSSFFLMFPLFHCFLWNSAKPHA